jgi:flagellar motor switch protein FliG
VRNARKAAVLLMSLDPSTAAELLRSAKQETITEIAAELAYLGSGPAVKDPALQGSVQEFFGMLYKKQKKRSVSPEDFVKEILKTTLGDQAAREALEQVNKKVKARDPFIHIRSAAVPDIAAALAGESPQVAAMVISELPPARSAELVSLLDEDTRARAIHYMTGGGQAVSPEARLRVAETVQNRLAQASRVVSPGTPQVARDQQLRKVALLLRGMKVDLRDGLFKSLEQQDAQAAESVRKLMVTWEDIAYVAERALQEALRAVDSRKLAMALVGADPQTVNRARANISERARAMLDEETSLMSATKPEDVEQARQEVLNTLREINSRGELNFEQSEQ